MGKAYHVYGSQQRHSRHIRSLTGAIFGGQQRIAAIALNDWLREISIYGREQPEFGWHAPNRPALETLAGRARAAWWIGVFEQVWLFTDENKNKLEAVEHLRERAVRIVHCSPDQPIAR